MKSVEFQVFNQLMDRVNQEIDNVPDEIWNAVLEQVHTPVGARLWRQVVEMYENE